MIQKNKVERKSTIHFSKIIRAAAAFVLLLSTMFVQKTMAQSCPPLANTDTCNAYHLATPCQATVPHWCVDFTSVSTFTTPFAARTGNCCGTTSPDRCVNFVICVGPNTAAVRFEICAGNQPPGALNYNIDCGGPLDIRTLGCISTPGVHTVSFCKPGNNLNQYCLTAIPRPTPMRDDSIRVGCFDTLTYSGVHVTGATWNSIFPGVPGQYNSFLSTPFAHLPDSSTSVVVTPSGTPPAFVDYRVCGQAIATDCIGLTTFCDTIRVYFFGNLVANISPDPAKFCAAQGGMTLTGSATGGLPPYTYVWRNAANVIVDNDSSFFVSSPGTYRLFVQDQLFDPAACNTSVDTIVVTLDSIAISETHVNASCNGVCDGSITTTVSGGTPPYSFVWSDIGPGGANRTNLCVGTYTVTVTTGGGACVASRTIVISQPATFVVVVDSIKNAGCNSEATGAVYTHTTGGTGPVNCIWSNGFTTPGITNVLSGTYCITCTDAHGCQDTACAFVDQPAVLVPLITSVNINGNNVSCFGAADDTSCAVVTGGTLPYTYLWTPSSLTTQCVIGQGGGSLICVTVTDANGCTGDTCKSITQPDLLELSIDDLSSFICGYQVSCFGAIDGFIDVTTHGGTAPFCYDWSDIPGTCPADEGEDRSGIGAGTYTVTVTDVNGCTASISVTLTEPAVVYDSIVSPLTAGGYNIRCRGECNGKIYSNVVGGCPPYTFTWTPNVSSADSAVDLCAGFYMLTVTDVNGCSFTDTLSVTEPDTVLALITVVILNAGNPVSCYGVCDGTAYVTASGGSPPYTYSWTYPPLSTPTFNPGGDSIFAVCAGPLSVTVADTNGCSASDNNTITEPPLLTATVVVNTYNGGWNVSCNGVCDGSATATPAGGTPPYTYLWCDGQTTASTSATLCPGPCAVTVTDDNGCDTTIIFTITEPPVLSVSITPDVRNCGFNISCNGACDGVAHTTVVGGTAPYTYAWSTAPVQTTDSATDLCATTYTVTVTDDNGCTATASVTLTEPTPLVIPPLTADTCAGGWNVCCNADTTGNVHSFPFGGCLPYTYEWSNGDTDDVANNVSVSIYFLTVTDANGCIAHSDTATLTEPPPLIDSITVAAVNITCAGACDGSATAVPVGGTAPYTYVWSNGQTGQTDTALCAGSYTVLITDANGCFTTDSVTLIGPPPLTTAITVDTFAGGWNVSCNGLCDGQATADTIGGTPPYTYSWSTTPVQNTQTATNLCAGTYTVTVTDDNGCTATASVTLNEPPLLTVNITGSNFNGSGEPCNSLCQDTLTANPTGGTAPYTYLWSNGCNTVSCPNLCAGTYTVTVTDANGCTATASYNITEPPVLTVTITALNFNGWGEPCNGDCLNNLTANPVGGTPPYAYAWSNGCTTVSCPNICAGTYTVTVTDANGCTATANVTITEPPVLTVSISDHNFNGWGEPCNGSCQDTLFATAAGGTPLYTYLWSNGCTSASCPNICAGTYSVIVTDANNCTVSTSFTVTEPPVLTVNISDLNFNGWDEPCNGSCQDTLTATAAGGTPTLNYQWSTGAATSVISNVCAGTYTVTVTDVNGCTATASYTVTEPPALSDLMSVSVLNPPYNTSCPDTCDAWALITVSGGTPGYTYVWSTVPSQTAPMATALCDSVPFGGGGTLYTVIVTDTNGCVLTDTVRIQAPYQPVSIIVTSDTSICATSLTLNAQPPAAIYQGQWSVLSGYGVFVPNDTLPTVTVDSLSYGTNVIGWRVYDGMCDVQTSITIHAYEPVNADADGPYLPICQEDEPVELHADTGYVGVGMWSVFADTITAIVFDNPYDPHTFAHGFGWNMNTLVWTVTNGPCVDHDTVNILKLIPELCDSACLEIPTAFSPNGDSYNDFFVVHCIEYSFNRHNEFKVFNRWGNLVYEKTDYLNDWYGQTNTGDENSGSPLPDGTYFVILSINNTPRYPEGRVLHGYVDLRR